MKRTSTDPFEPTDPGSNVKTAERGTYVQETMKGTPMETTQGSAPLTAETTQMALLTPGVVMSYRRLVEYSPELQLVPLDEMSGTELLLFHYDEYSGENGTFLTLELAPVSRPDEHFLANCGGQNVMRAVKSAFSGPNSGPFLVEFNKVLTSSGRSLWTIR